MGWGAELLQGAFLIADDIMDEAEMRRGKPAWYRLEKVFLSLTHKLGGNDEH